MANEPRTMRGQQVSNGQSVVITGCSSGIGCATAVHLDLLGYRVFAGVRSSSDGEDLVRASSGRIEPLLMDVTESESISASSARVRGALGNGEGLKGIVNNAGFAMTSPLEFVDLDALRHQFEVNVIGVAAVTKAFLPLIVRPGGRVVNMSSGSGKIVTPLIGPYCASKYALEAMSDALRIELRSEGLHVSIIEPGVIETPIHEKNDERTRRMTEALPALARERYGPALDRLNAQSAKFAKSATPAIRVARAVARALSAKRPKTRYPVTTEAHLLSWIGPFLPDRARDAIFGGMLGL